MSEAGASFEMIPVDKCDACDGDGWVHVWSQDGMSVVADRDCDECSGTGDANAERSPSWWDVRCLPSDVASGGVAMSAQTFRITWVAIFAVTAIGMALR